MSDVLRGPPLHVARHLHGLELCRSLFALGYRPSRLDLRFAWVTRDSQFYEMLLRHSNYKHRYANPFPKTTIKKTEEIGYFGDHENDHYSSLTVSGVRAVITQPLQRTKNHHGFCAVYNKRSAFYEEKKYDNEIKCLVSHQGPLLWPCPHGAFFYGGHDCGPCAPYWVCQHCLEFGRRQHKNLREVVEHAVMSYLPSIPLPVNQPHTDHLTYVRLWSTRQYARRRRTYALCNSTALRPRRPVL